MGGRAEPLPGGITERSAQDLKYAGPEAYAFEPKAPKVDTKPIDTPVLPPPSKVVEPEKNKPKRKPRTAKTEVYPYPSQDTLKMQELKEELDNLDVGNN
jgi:hypothetical protein